MAAGPHWSVCQSSAFVSAADSAVSQFSEYFMHTINSHKHETELYLPGMHPSNFLNSHLCFYVPADAE